MISLKAKAMWIDGLKICGLSGIEEDGPVGYYKNPGGMVVFH